MSRWDGSLGKITQAWVSGFDPPKVWKERTNPPPQSCSVIFQECPGTWNPTFTSTQLIIINNNRQSKWVDPQTTKWCLEHGEGGAVCPDTGISGIARNEGVKPAAPLIYMHTYIHPGEAAAPLIYILIYIPGKLRSLQDQHLSAWRYCDKTTPHPVYKRTN